MRFIITAPFAPSVEDLHCAWANRPEYFNFLDVVEWRALRRCTTEEEIETEYRASVFLYACHHSGCPIEVSSFLRSRSPDRLRSLPVRFLSGEQWPNVAVETEGDGISRIVLPSESSSYVVASAVHPMSRWEIAAIDTVESQFPALVPPTPAPAPLIGRASLPTVTLKLCKHSDCSAVATGYQGYCLEHSPIRHLGRYSSRLAPPASAANPIGLELEMLNERRNGLPHLSRCVVSDGSLDAGGGEVKLCGDASRIAAKAASLVARAKLSGAKVNHSCGVHVHLSLPRDCRNWGWWESSTMGHLFEYAEAAQSWLFDLMPQSRQNSTYCRRMERASQLTNHYSWLSLSSSAPTVEVRIHPGTLNASKLVAWIGICKAVRQDVHDIVSNKADNVAERVASFDSFAGRFAPNSLERAYLMARKASPSLTSFGW